MLKSLEAIGKIFEGYQIFEALKNPDNPEGIPKRLEAIRKSLDETTNALEEIAKTHAT